MRNLINSFPKKIILILTVIASIELISLINYLNPGLNNTVFFSLAFVFLVIALKNSSIALLILFIEIFIGSKGYLFYFESGGLILPIRIAFWIIIMSVWLAKANLNFFAKKQSISSQIPLLKSNYLNYLSILAIFISLGVVNGLLSENTSNNIFFDANAWLYFLLILPIYAEFSQSNQLEKIKLVFVSAVTWVTIKTFFILYLFSHNFSFIGPIYKWVRTTGAGEITLIEEGFYRVFLQSHIFSLVAFFAALIYFIETIKKTTKKNHVLLLLVLSCSFSVLIIAQSRSFWVGLVAGLAVYLLFELLYSTTKVRFIFRTLSYLSIVFVVSLFIVISIVKFPYPNLVGDFTTTDLLAKRVSVESSEAAVSSRWALLPLLMDQIKISPITGGGFGSTITYISSDPRVRESTAIGEYTTYAFEWGWLDIWLKIGLLGLIAYISLIGKLLFDSFVAFKVKKEVFIFKYLPLSLISILVVNIFSPYFNHPLGIVFLIIMIAIYDFHLHGIHKTSSNT